MTFGEKVKAERKKRGLKQQELADILGVNRRMITRYENNVSVPRTREGYQKIADCFGLNIDYFLTESEEFVARATEQYGSRGRKQAEELLEDMSGLFAGGELTEEDKDAVMKVMQQIYWDSKSRNREKYTPKKYKLSDVE